MNKAFVPTGHEADHDMFDPTTAEPLFVLVSTDGSDEVCLISRYTQNALISRVPVYTVHAGRIGEPLEYVRTVSQYERATNTRRMFVIGYHLYSCFEITPDRLLHEKPKLKMVHYDNRKTTLINGLLDDFTVTYGPTIEVNHKHDHVMEDVVTLLRDCCEAIIKYIDDGGSVTVQFSDAQKMLLAHVDVITDSALPNGIGLPVPRTFVTALRRLSQEYRAYQDKGWSFTEDKFFMRRFHAIIYALLSPLGIPISTPVYVPEMKRPW